MSADATTTAATAADTAASSTRGVDVYQPTTHCATSSHLGGTLAARVAKYEAVNADIPGFWAATAANDFHWSTPFNPTDVLSYNFDKTKGEVFQKWFAGGKTNVCYNCLDRHLPEYAAQVAFFWEGNDCGEASAMTYGQLYDEVVKLATVLRREYNIKKGDRVSIYLPMITLGPVAMLALARIGAVASVVFGGFSAQSLSARLIDSQSSLLITADGTFRGDKPIRLKQIADEALAECAAAGLNVKCLVYARHESHPSKVPMTEGRDKWYHDLVTPGPLPSTADASIEWVDAEDPLFMLYTSGSTGKPKGLIHTTGGYMVYAATTFKYVFDYHPGDVYFCTADIGWITGHSYVVYGPLLNRATSILFEGIPSHPTASRWWELVDKYQVSIFYTAPTAIRSLMKAGDAAVTKTSRKSLRVLGSVGEPINVAAWDWYYQVVGERRCDIVDTWWQTETGGIMITPLPGTTPLKPSSATLPFFGIRPVVCDANAQSVPFHPTEACEGHLCIGHPWPGQARTIYGDHSRYVDTYFSTHPGYYFTGDGCRRDADGYYWLTGRVDDVLNVSGHRLGTSEVECAINTQKDVAESAVVGMPHDIKGEGIYAYVTFKPGVTVTPALLGEIKTVVRTVIGPLATPDVVQNAPNLPKTRSGKIMRRILRKIACGQFTELGDVSTLSDPHCVEELISLRPKI